jgi:hypothetical protein
LKLANPHPPLWQALTCPPTEIPVLKVSILPLRKNISAPCDRSNLIEKKSTRDRYLLTKLEI